MARRGPRRMGATRIGAGRACGLEPACGLDGRGSELWARKIESVGRAAGPRPRPPDAKSARARDRAPGPNTESAGPRHRECKTPIRRPPGTVTENMDTESTLRDDRRHPTQMVRGTARRWLYIEAGRSLCRAPALSGVYGGAGLCRAPAFSLSRSGLGLSASRPVRP